MAEPVQIEADNGTSIKSQDVPHDASSKPSNGAHIESVPAEANGAAAADATAPPKKDIATTRKPRGPTKAQQLNKLYSLPLPLRTFPLPTFVPHNPLSIFQLLYTWLSQTLSPPSSHPEVPYQGIFSPSLRAVHITDPVSIRALWEQGFYGKGSLSRSELSWLDREKRRIGEGASKTSEEVTRQRRAERQQVKWERARLQQEAIEAKRREEELAAKAADADVAAAVIGHSKPLTAHVDVAPTAPGQLLAMPNSTADMVVVDAESQTTTASNDEPSMAGEDTISQDDASSSAPVTTSSKSVRFSPTTEEQAFIASDPILPATSSSNLLVADAEEPPLIIKDKEHLQLTTEEAFFLHYGLGVLAIHSPSTHVPIPTPDLFTLFRRSSHFPALPAEEMLRPDDAFILNYVVYHHFRSLGWVVRGGVKFGVDYLLYNRGPVFSHAEFAVIVIPSYSAAYWQSSEASVGYPEGRKCYVQEKLRQRGKWSWVHAVNRVNAQVKKTVVLVYVDVPEPVEEGERGIDEVLGRYTVREVVLRRWVSNRSRD